MSQLSPEVRERFIKQVREAQHQRRKSNAAFIVLASSLIACIMYLVSHIH
jgi:hypothetical protein